MAEKWIQGAIKHPGALHEQLGIPQGQKIPAKKMAAASSGKYGELAEDARIWHILLAVSITCITSKVPSRGPAERLDGIRTAECSDYAD